MDKIIPILLIYQQKNQTFQFLWTYPLDERRGAAANQVHHVENDEAANTGEHFTCERRSRAEYQYQYIILPLKLILIYA